MSVRFDPILEQILTKYIKTTGDRATGTLEIDVPTATSEALILKTTDDNATKNLFEVQNSSGSSLAEIDSAGLLLLNPNTPVVSGFKAFSIGRSSTSQVSSTTSIDIRAWYPTIKQELYRTTGSGYAYSFFDGYVTNDTSTVNTSQIGAFGSLNQGSSPSLTYLYISSISSPAYNNANFYLHDTGNVSIGINNTNDSSALHVQTNASTGKGIIVKGAASQTANLTEWQNSSGGVLTRIDNNGFIQQNPIIKTDLTNGFGINQDITWSPASSPTSSFGGLNYTIRTGGSQSFNSVEVYGSFSRVNYSSTGTAGTVYGLSSQIDTGASAGSVNQARGLNVLIANTSSNNITNGYGLYVNPAINTGSGNINNLYGVYVGNQTVGSILNYAIYTNAGEVSVGDTLTTRGDRVKSTETSTTTATISDSVEVHICNGTSTYVVTLPTHSSGKEIRIINKGSAPVTLSPTSGTIKGSSSESLLTWESLILISDGTDWL